MTNADRYASLRETAIPCLDQAHGKDWSFYHGDSCQVLKALPDRSIDYVMTSIPFSSLYTYSPSSFDLGNCTSDEQFADHFGFLAKEMFRFIRPGRIISIHVMDLPTTISRDGVIGLRDFRGQTIEIFQRAGFVYHSNVTIWKDPVVQQARTNAIGLLYMTLRGDRKTLAKDEYGGDSSMSRMGLADYLLQFYRPEEADMMDLFRLFCEVFGQWHRVDFRHPEPNEEPVQHSENSFPLERWQRYASPVWPSVKESDTLQYMSAREFPDEKHICLARGSMVLTRDGFKPIENVLTGDMVITHRGRWRPVTAVRCNGVQPIVKVQAQGVAGLHCTPDHRLWTRIGSGSHPRSSAMRTEPQWVEARETIGSYLNLKLPPVEESTLSADDWWIVGRYLGDGHLTARGFPFISFDGSERDELIGKMGKRAGAINKTTTAFQVYIKGSGGKGGHHDDPLHLMIRKCGTGAAVKQLPVEALTLNGELAEALLGGYLSADGHLDNLGRWHATSVSRALALGIAMLAQRARYCVASVYAGREAGTAVIQGRTVTTRDEWRIMLSKKNGSGFILDDGAWKKVRSISTAGDAEVWDLQVEEDESFTAEGCVVHNCPLQLEVIRRGIELWSNPGDVVLDPFGGIGSTPVVAVEMGRRAVACELKPSYWRQGVENVRRASPESKKQLSLEFGR